MHNQRVKLTGTTLRSIPAAYPRRYAQKENVIKWEILESLDVPCADISYCWFSERNPRLVITMHFSRVIGGFDKDIELTFTSPMAVQWEDETFGLIDLPELPACAATEFKSYTYPTLIVPDSKWADLYAARTHTAEEYKSHKVAHYAFVSMNDLLHVLSQENPSVRVVEARNA